MWQAPSRTAKLQKVYLWGHIITLYSPTGGIYQNFSIRLTIGSGLHMDLIARPLDNTLWCTFLLLKEPVSWRTATRNGGHQVWNSFTHWCMTVAGQTITVGPNPAYLHKRRPSNQKCLPHKRKILFAVMNIFIKMSHMSKMACRKMKSKKKSFLWSNLMCRWREHRTQAQGLVK